MSNAQTFVEKYKLFESAVRTTYDLSNEQSVRNFLCAQPEFERFQTEIVCCQETRNLLQHQPMIRGEYPIEPSDKLIEALDMLTARVLDKKTCIDICVKAKHVLSAKPHDSVKQIMVTMREKGFLCVPVVDDGNRVVGIFSESSVFDYLADKGALELRDELSFDDLREYIGIEGREGVLNLFLPHDYPVDKLMNRIKSAVDAADRFQVAIITNNGNESEPMQGIVTLWDVAMSYDQ